MEGIMKEKMTLSKAYAILEERQRAMTQRRYAYSDMDIELNGISLLAIERLIEKPVIAQRNEQCFCPNVECQYSFGDVADIRKMFKNLRPKCCKECGQKLNWGEYDDIQ